MKNRKKKNQNNQNKIIFCNAIICLAIRLVSYNLKVMARKVKTVVDKDLV